MIGWLKLHRKIRKSPMYRSLNSKQRDVMMQCLLLANHEENEWHWQGDIYKCKTGQFITSLDSLAKECASDVKVQSVRTALLKLEKWGFLTNESTKTGRLITLINWDTYQIKEEDTNKQTNKQLTKRQQSSNKELTTIEEIKNVKNNKEEKNNSVSRPDNISEQVWKDFVKLRTKKRAPITETAIEGIDSEAKKAGMTLEEVLVKCCKMGWQGFEASWVKSGKSDAKSRHI